MNEKKPQMKKNGLNSTKGPSRDFHLFVSRIYLYIQASYNCVFCNHLNLILKHQIVLVLGRDFGTTKNVKEVRGALVRGTRVRGALIF